MTSPGPRKVELETLRGEYAVCRLPPDSALPGWALADRDFVSCDFVSVSRTHDELSIVCPAELVPAGIRAERGWSVLKVAGPLDFSEIGILASLATPLAAVGVGIFVVSTFDTDYLLVRTDALERALACLIDAGHQILSSEGGT